MGWLGLYETLDTQLFDLLIDGGDRSALARSIHDALCSLPEIDRIAPFDGTLQAELDENENEADWVLTHDIQPFVERWSDVLLGYEPKAAVT